MKNIYIVILVIVALGGGFFGGMQYQKSNGQQMRSRFGIVQNGQNFRPIRGQVLSVDATGMTVKMQNGTSRIVVVSSATQYVKSAAANKTDVAAGDTVMVIGIQNSDGSITAQNVQINPSINR